MLGEISVTRVHSDAVADVQAGLEVPEAGYVEPEVLVDPCLNNLYVTM